MFDTITYAKGGSVLQMVNYFLGQDTFYKGLIVSLKKKKNIEFENYRLNLF